MKLRQTSPATPPTWSPLVPIQPHGERTPLFCVHPAGGTVLCYYELARLLGDNQPFYGLQAPGIEVGREPLTQVEALAEAYLQVICSVQPDGPYYLLGWSFGGW